MATSFNYSIFYRKSQLSTPKCLCYNNSMGIFVILALLALAIFGFVFFCWGVYQIRTGKMVAHRVKNSIDAPREVGLVFLVLGTFLLIMPILAIIALFYSVFIAGVLFLLSFLIPSILLTTVGIFNLIKKHIFTVRSDRYSKKLIKKFYFPCAILQIISGLAFISCIFLTMNPVAFTICLIFGFVAFLIFTILFCLLSHFYKQARG